MRLPIALAAALALLPATALAGPGGQLAGNLSVSWATDGWNGSVSVALDPGAAARDAAVARIKSVNHVRTGSPFSTEGAHLTGLTSVRSTSFDCGEGMQTKASTYGSIVDGDVPFFVDRPFLDLLRGTGHIQVEPVWDNYGDPLPQTGRDFFPLPGSVNVTYSDSGCGESFPPASEDDVAPIFGTGTDVAVPFGVPIFLRSEEIPLREHGGVWSTSGTTHDRVLGSLPVDFTWDLRLLGALKSWVAICKVPVDKDLAKARSASAALAVVRRAGWPKARFAGRQPTFYHRRGHYFVDEKFSSSGLAGCLTGKPKLFLAIRAS